MKLRYAPIFALVVACSLGISGRGGVRAQSDDRVAFASDRDGNLEIYVMQPDGTDIQRLTHDPGQDIDPAWSPDRQQIAFVSNRDGSNFAIYLMNADGSNVRRVTPDDANYYTAPAWSPDGRYLALVSDRTGNLDVHILDLSSGTLRAVTDDPDEDNEPSWSPDGSRIAFSSFRTGYGEIYTVSASGGPVQALTSGSGADNLAPVWSPDGTQLAFVANSGLFSEIYIVNADGSNERNLITVDEYFIDSPSWSPDGQHITYQVSKPGEKATIRSIQADGNGARQVTVPDYESKWPSWSTPRGGTVNVAGGGQASVVQVDCPGAAPTRLSTGMRARVTPGPPNTLRDGPAGNRVGTIPGGGEFDILGGPSCSSGYLWWQVSYAGQVGWTAEGVPGEYWLEPLQASGQVAAANVITNFEAGTCGGRPTRFKVGDVVVVTQIGNGLRILTEAGGGAHNALDQGNPGDRLEITNGPVCGRLRAYDQPSWYWYIYSYADRLSGWVAEGPITEQWICPVNDPHCSPQ